MRSYSQDIRDRVIELSEQGHKSVQIAERLKVSRSFAGRVLQRFREQGQRNAYQIGGHRNRIIKEHEKRLIQWVQNEPGLTLEQLCERCEKQLSLTISITTMWRELKRLDLRYKKNDLCQ